MGAMAALNGAAPGEIRCGGCGAKVGSAILGRVLRRLQPPARPDMLIGLDPADDAAVLSVPGNQRLVRSVDFFRVFIDDPYLFDRIAANRCLGDLYAMFLTEGAYKAPGGLLRVRLLARADHILDIEIGGLRIRSLRHRRSRNARPGPGLGRGRHNLTHLDRDLVAPGLRGISIRSIGPGHRPTVSRRRRSSTTS